jgi:ABC-type transport system involved in multi-copper enzyme maturation permease subunit
LRSFFRDTWIVGRYELADAVRSRRALVVLILFLAAGILICNGVVSFIFKAEAQISETLGLPASTSAGVVTDALWEYKGFKRLMIELVGDRAVALELLAVPPMVMIFSWLTFTLAPILVMITSSTRISEELGCGSIRFVALRTSRAAWVLGIFMGQALLLILALLLSAIGAWCVFRFRLADIDSMAMGRGMIVYAWKVWVYSLSFIGLALGISQTTHSANKAMSFGCLAWFGFWVLYGIASFRLDNGGTKAWQLVEILTPMGHCLDMWRSDFAHQVQATFFLASLGLVYLFSGYFWFARKDV